jgi:hypothetical protein
MVVCMPQQRCHNLSSSSWGAAPSAVWLLTLLFFAGRLNHSCSWSVYIMFGLFLCFTLFYHAAGQKKHCSIDIGDMHDGVGIHPVSLEDPIVATYPIQAYCNTPGGLMLDQKKNCAKKFTISGYGCSLRSCCVIRSITRCISDRMCWISSYTITR